MPTKKGSSHYKARYAHCRSSKNRNAMDSRRSPHSFGSTPIRILLMLNMQGRRLGNISLNLGGLFQIAWDELQVWLPHLWEADVLLLQETHCGFVNLFDISQFWVVHLGA